MWKKICSYVCVCRNNRCDIILLYRGWREQRRRYGVIIWENAGNKRNDKNFCQCFINERRIVRALSFTSLLSHTFSVLDATQKRMEKEEEKKRFCRLCFSLLSFKTARRHLHLLKNKMNRAEEKKQRNKNTKREEHTNKQKKDDGQT